MPGVDGHSVTAGDTTTRAGDQRGVCGMQRLCLVCGHIHNNPRLSACGTTAARGYGATHQRARAQLARTLPASCAYQGIDPHCPATPLTLDSPWVAAHIVDGQPERGWQPAHPS